MQKQAGLTERKSIAAFTLWGLIGCGVGALVGSLIGWLTVASTASEQDGDPLMGVFILAYLMMGAGGGAALGLALKKRRVPVVAVLGFVGFGIALLFGFAIQVFLGPDIFASLSEYAAIAIRSAITGAIFGAVGGAVLGLALRGWKGAGFLALAGVIPGAIIFAIQFVVAQRMSEMPLLQYPQTQIPVLITIAGLAISAVAMGAALGAAIGYLEKRKAETQG